MDKTRREFLKLFALGVGSFVYGSEIFAQKKNSVKTQITKKGAYPQKTTLQGGKKQEPPLKYDIIYSRDNELESILDYNSIIGQILGPNVRKHLQILRDGKEFVLLYYRNADSKTANMLAKNHSKLIKGE